mgnify:CR=1 FL=1
MNFQCTHINIQNRRCKHTRTNLQIQNLCCIHSKLLYNKYVIYIQKMYRGYKCRKKLKNIYNKLPDDVQRIILSKINRDHHIKKYKNTIKKILHKKTDKFNNYHKYNELFTIDDIIKYYKLYIKYNVLIEKVYLKHFFILADQLKQYCFILIEPNIHTFQTYIYPIYNKIDINSVTLKNTIELLELLNNYIFYYNTDFMKKCFFNQDL